MMDRRFKDVLDIMTILKYDYTNGITKKKLLSLLEDNPHLLESYLSEENIASQITQAKKFKPQILNMDSVIEYANSFTELISGLASDNVHDYDLFVTGKWRGDDKSESI